MSPFEAWKPWLRTPSSDLLRAAVVEIRDGTGEHRLGTGTIVAPDGSLLTCHHVVSDLPEVTLLHNPTGRRAVVPVVPDDITATCDLAILRSGWTDIAPVPMAFTASGDWLAYGFQDLGLGFVAAVPLSGSYRHGGRRQYVQGNSYDVADMLDLEGTAVHGGTSGAALFNPATACITGIVSASLTDPRDPTPMAGRSIAVSLGDEAMAWPPLAALASAAEVVPRFGDCLNGIGTQLLTGAQRFTTIEDLITLGLIDRQRLLMRAGLGEALQRFLAGDRPIMPIVGQSGTGKTSIAAMLAGSFDEPHTLLLRGVHMQGADVDISTQIERALTDVDQGTYGLDEVLRPDLPRPSAETLAASAAAAGRPLLIVLDAINERDDDTLPARKIADQWFPRTARWLRKNNARLIVTCRAETWRLLLPPALDRDIYPPAGTDQSPREDWRPPNGISNAPEGGLMIGDLADSEIDLMLRAYGLDERDVAWRSARHPFLLRLAAELRQDPRTEGRVSEVSLLEHAIANRTRQVATEISESGANIEEIEALVSAIARAMLLAGSDRIPIATARALPLADPMLLQALIDEGILDRIGHNYRFRFDQYADIERARLLVLPLRDDLGGLAPQLAEPGMWSTIALAATNMYEAAEGMRGDPLGPVGVYELRNSIAADPGPVELRLGLLLEVARNSRDGYGVRVKDWHDERRNGNDLDYWLRITGIDKQLRLLHAEDGPAVLRTLVLRLSDERPLMGGENHEGTISSLSGGCICALDDARLEVHYAELLNHRSSYIGRSVLEVTMRQRPEQLVAWLLSEVGANAEARTSWTPEGRLRAIDLLLDATRIMPDTYPPRAASALQGLLGDTDDGVRAAAAAAIRKLDPTNERALALLLEALQPDRSDKEFDIGLSQLATIPPDQVRPVLDLILGRLNRPASQWHVADYGFGRHAVDRLRSAEFAPFATEIVTLLEAHAGEDNEADRDIVEWATHAIRHFKPEDSAYRQILSLIDKVARGGNERVEVPLVDAGYCNLNRDWPQAAHAVRLIIEKHGIGSNATQWMLLNCRQNSEPAAERVAMAAAHRQRDPRYWDDAALAEMRGLSPGSDDAEKLSWDFAEALVAYWRTLPPDQLTADPREVLALLDGGETLRRVFRIQGKWPAELLN